MVISPEQTSSYLEYLPAIFSEDPFLGRFLLAFEQVLTGLEGAQGNPKQGLEAKIAQIAQLFAPNEIFQFFISDENGTIDNLDPETLETLQEFIHWLAGWTALGLRADWGLEQQQQFLARIVPLYRRRGTKKNLEEFLAIYTGLVPTIEEPQNSPFQIGVNSTIGVDTQLGGDIPHYFKVTARMASRDVKTLQRQRLIIQSLIDLQKPAHTYYDLTITSPGMRIGLDPVSNQPLCIVGVNTLLGTPETTT